MFTLQKLLLVLVIIVPTVAWSEDGSVISDEERAARPVQIATEAYDLALKSWQRGLADIDKVYMWSLRLSETQRQAVATKVEREAAIHSHTSRMYQLQSEAKKRAQLGQIDALELKAASWFVLDARAREVAAEQVAQPMNQTEVDQLKRDIEDLRKRLNSGSNSAYASLAELRNLSHAVELLDRQINPPPKENQEDRKVEK